MADDQGALPTDPTTDNAPPMPAAAPAAAGQQQFGGGALPTGSDQTMGGAAPTAAPTPGPDPQKIKEYLQGGGAMPKNYYDNLRMQIEQTGIKDPNEITAHAVAQGGPPALQATRQHYDTARAFAVKNIQDGNLDNAADAANKAFQYVPDGTKAMVTASKDGFGVSVHTPDGQAQNYNLTPDQMTQVFKGKDGFFDHMTGKGVNGVIDAITRAQNPEGGFGGPPAGSQQTSPGTATETTPGIPQTQSYPGNKAPAPTKAGPNQAPVVGGSPGGNPNPERTDINATLGQPGGPVTAPAGGGSTLPAGAKITDPRTGKTTQLPPGYTVAKDLEGNQIVLKPGEGYNRETATVYDKPGSQVFGMPNAPQPHNIRATTPGGSVEQDIDRGPISITRRGVTTQTGNTDVGTPEQQRMARAIHPSNPEGQAQWIANENQQSQTRGSAENIARIRGPETQQVRAAGANQAAETRGSYMLRVAEARAQQLANHPQADMAGQGRNAVKVLSEIRQMNPNITPVDLDNELRHRGINPTNILKPFTPEEEQNAPQAQPQGRKLGSNDPRTQQAPELTQAGVKPPPSEPTATNQQTGEKMVYRGGKWIPLQ